MKRLSKLFISISIFLSFLTITPVQAASMSVKASSSTVYVGSSFKVTVNASGYIGKFQVVGSNNVSISSSPFWLEDGSTALTATATAEGPATITLNTVDVATTSGQAVSMSKSCSVTIKNKEDTTKGDNSLKSLTVENGTLSPKFKKSTTSYTVSMPIGSTSTTIKATPTQSKATVTGDGKKTLKEGTNDFNIVVTAENGSKKTYKLSISVPKSPSVYVDIDGKKYGVIEEINEDSIPANFSLSTTTVEGSEVTCLTNSSNTVTLLYLIDEDNNYNFYIYDGTNYTLYNPITLDNRSFVVMKIDTPFDNTVESELMIDDTVIEGGYTFVNESMSNYYLFHLLNVETGLDNLYLYETTEGTIQIYTAVETTVSSTSTLTIIFGVVSGVLLMALIGFFFYFRHFKMKTYLAIKDYYKNLYQKNAKDD